MHPAILMSLLGSFHDVFGLISFEDARIVIEKLKIDDPDKHYISLKENLFKFNSKAEYWTDRDKKNNNIR